MGNVKNFYFFLIFIIFGQAAWLFRQKKQFLQLILLGRLRFTVVIALTVTDFQIFNIV